MAVHRSFVYRPVTRHTFDPERAIQNDERTVQEREIGSAAPRVPFVHCIRLTIFMVVHYEAIIVAFGELSVCSHLASYFCYTCPHISIIQCF